MNYLFVIVGIVAIFIVVTTLFFLVNGRKQGTGQNYVSEDKYTPVIFYSVIVVFLIVLVFVGVLREDVRKNDNDVKVEDPISKQTNPFSDLNPFKKEPLNQGEN